MVHLPALPGSPYGEAGGREQILAAAMRDREALLDAGFDAISISNEGDRPYLTSVPVETVALFTYLAGELARDLAVPFGCGVLIDPRASLAVAAAIGARFVRLSYTVEAGAFGLVVQSPAELLRYRRQIGAEAVELLVNYSAHFSTSLDTRPIVEIARTYSALSRPDAIQVHGAGAGVMPDLGDVRAVREAVPGVPVLVASGVGEEAVAAALADGDGIIVGSCLKRDGNLQPDRPGAGQAVHGERALRAVGDHAAGSRHRHRHDVRQGRHAGARR